MTVLTKLGAGMFAAAATVLVAACGSGSSGGTGGPSGAVGAAATGTSAAALHTATTSIGTVLVDARGHTVYELAGNTAAHQKCTGGCQATWRPVMSGGHVKVVNGHPAFTFAGDSGAGQTNGQGVTDTWGHWSALDANGDPVTTTSASSPATGGGGQYGY